MCIIVVKPMGSSFAREYVINCADHNSHGSGVAHIDRTTKRIVVDKTMAKGPEVADLFEKHVADSNNGLVILHCRIATQGLHNEANCHPFWIENKDEGDKYDTVMFHNGVIKVPETNKDMSDSWHFATEWLKPIFKGNPKLWDSDEFWSIIGTNIGGSKLAILSTRGGGAYRIVNSQFGSWWEHDKKVWVSNGSWESRRATISNYSHGGYSGIGSYNSNKNHDTEAYGHFNGRFGGRHNTKDYFKTDYVSSSKYAVLHRVWNQWTNKWEEARIGYSEQHHSDSYFLETMWPEKLPEGRWEELTSESDKRFGEFVKGRKGWRYIHHGKNKLAKTIWVEDVKAYKTKHQEEVAKRKAEKVASLERLNSEVAAAAEAGKSEFAKATEPAGGNDLFRERSDSDGGSNLVRTEQATATRRISEAATESPSYVERWNSHGAWTPPNRVPVEVGSDPKVVAPKEEGGKIIQMPSTGFRRLEDFSHGSNDGTNGNPWLPKANEDSGVERWNNGWRRRFANGREVWFRHHLTPTPYTEISGKMPSTASFRVAPEGITTQALKNLRRADIYRITMESPILIATWLADQPINLDRGVNIEEAMKLCTDEPFSTAAWIGKYLGIKVEVD